MTDELEATDQPAQVRRVADYTPSDEFLETLEPRLLLAYFIEVMSPLSDEDYERFGAEAEKDEKVRELRNRLIEALERDRLSNSR